MARTHARLASSIPRWVTNPGQARGVGDLCEPDAVLPSQFYSQGSKADRGVLALLAAVLDDALRCYLRRPGGGGHPNKGREQREAEDWFADTDHVYPFTFESIAEVLGADAAAIRRRLPQLLNGAKLGRVRSNGHAGSPVRIGAR